MKRQLALALVPALLALASFPAWGSDGDISFVATLQGTDSQAGYECNGWNIKFNNGKGSQPYGSCVPPTFTVYAVPGGASAGGITGVEWSVVVEPVNTTSFPGYVVFPVPLHNATTQLGSAFLSTPRGENLAWEFCQTGDAAGRIPLYRVLVFPLSPCGPSQRPGELRIVAGQHSSPSNVFFRCPLFTLCDGPFYTKVCLGDNLTLCQTQVPPFPIASTCSTTGEFEINTSGVSPGACSPPPGKVAAAGMIESSSWSNVKALYR